jgi:hypothetical protein
VAHQYTNHPVDHALEPHKEQKAACLEESMNNLFKFDPMRLRMENLIKDLRAVNTFKQSEEITTQFLKKHNKL